MAIADRRPIPHPISCMRSRYVYIGRLNVERMICSNRTVDREFAVGRLHSLFNRCCPCLKHGRFVEKSTPTTIRSRLSAARGAANTRHTAQVGDPAHEATKCSFRPPHSSPAGNRETEQAALKVKSTKHISISFPREANLKLHPAPGFGLTPTYHGTRGRITISRRHDRIKIVRRKATINQRCDDMTPYRPLPRRLSLTVWRCSDLVFFRGRFMILIGPARNTKSGRNECLTLHGLRYQSSHTNYSPSIAADSIDLLRSS